MEDYNRVILPELVRLARLGLVGRRQDIQLYVRRLSRKLRSMDLETAEALAALLRELPTPGSPLRNASVASIPVDQDSRFKLIRYEHPVTLDVTPVWSREIQEALDQVVEERRRGEELGEAGLTPTRSLLFKGKPGVGKTLAARWIAVQLGLPLLILDLSAVMSSFLGRTGTNLRNVFDYSKGTSCVLLLDELDAIAKKRDDAAEVGELKRLVTVLLQEIDDWPPDSILVAATNHPDLLDPAVWRRFEKIVEFPMPHGPTLDRAVQSLLYQELDENPILGRLISWALEGLSFAEIERELVTLRRRAVLQGGILGDVLNEWIQARLQEMPKKNQRDLAVMLVKAGYSQRQVNQWTGVSRDTLRKKTRT